MSDYVLEQMLLRIKEIKKVKKITNEKLSKQTNIPLGTLSKILAGITREPSIQSIIKISRALDVSSEYLIFGETAQSENLSKRENKLISDFRSLSKQGRDYVMQTMDMVKYKYTSEDENIAEDIAQELTQESYINSHTTSTK